MRAVADVTLTVGAGETVGLVGESGCGKTTLARAAVRLTAPTAGTIRFEGRDVGRAGRRAPAPLRGELAMVFQDPLGSLNPRRRVGDSVAQPLLLGGTAASAARARVAELLERVGLTRDHAGRWPHELSGGQRQRVGIARALASSPRPLGGDEPL
jgi:ABC-type glutathione transport system ATPase component